MRKLFTENRVLAFIQITLALSGGTFVTAITHSASSLPWLYLAAIFWLVTALLAAGLYRLFGDPKLSRVQPPVQPERPSRQPTVFEELNELLRKGEEIKREIEWQRLGKSLRLNSWRMNVGSLLYRRAPEYRSEMDGIARENQDDVELFERIKELIHRVMKDRNYRGSEV